MFENIINFIKKFTKKEKNISSSSKDTAKERLHLVLMQDRANVSADFLELMKQEIIDVIKKYIDIDEAAIDVRLTNKENEDGTNGAPALYANIPILNIKNDARKTENKEENKEEEKEEHKEEVNKPEKEEEDKKEETIKIQEADDVVEEEKKEENKEDSEEELKNQEENSEEEASTIIIDKRVV